MSITDERSLRIYELMVGDFITETSRELLCEAVVELVAEVRRLRDRLSALEAGRG